MIASCTRAAVLTCAPAQAASNADSLVDLSAFATLNKAMQEYDEKRETVIKESRGARSVTSALPHAAASACSLHRLHQKRNCLGSKQACACSADTQKLAKQAIYCLHRGDIKGAAAKLEKAKAAADKLKPIVEAEPSLRLCGSHCASLEEVCCHDAASRLRHSSVNLNLQSNLSVGQRLSDDTTEIQR